jgi:hypothetical protein
MGKKKHLGKRASSKKPQSSQGGGCIAIIGTDLPREERYREWRTREFQP